MTNIQKGFLITVGVLLAIIAVGFVSGMVGRK